MPSINCIQSFHTLYIGGNNARNIKDKLMEKNQSKGTIGMKTLERLCSKKFTYKKTYTITGNLMYLWLS